MKVLICGSRYFQNRTLLDKTLSQFDITEVIEGEAAGADILARLWAQEHNIPVQKFPAEWDKYGRFAGPIRNKQMLTEGKPDFVIAFLHPESRGTKNMIDQATKAGLKVHIVNI